MNLVIQVVLVIFRNLLILLNLAISGIFIYSCASEWSGAYGHSFDSGDSIESAHSCESGVFDKNSYSVDSDGSCDSGKFVFCFC